MAVSLLESARLIVSSATRTSLCVSFSPLIVRNVVIRYVLSGFLLVRFISIRYVLSRYILIRFILICFVLVMTKAERLSLVLTVYKV